MILRSPHCKHSKNYPVAGLEAAATKGEQRMEEQPISRRRLLQTAATLGVAGAMVRNTEDNAEAALRAGKTPAMTAAEMAAIDAAMGKKGTYNEAQATYTVALPRNDLK